MIRVALVGYTNVGKSTLMNRLTKTDVFAENKLFATLDTTTKNVTIDNKYNVLLSDTVGFLNKLPHALIASFKSTLGEINDANLIIKLVDISSDNIESEINTINNTLKYLDSYNKKSM